MNLKLSKAFLIFSFFLWYFPFSIASEESNYLTAKTGLGLIIGYSTYKCGCVLLRTLKLRNAHNNVKDSALKLCALNSRLEYKLSTLGSGIKPISLPIDRNAELSLVFEKKNCSQEFSYQRTELKTLSEKVQENWNNCNRPGSYSFDSKLRSLFTNSAIVQQQIHSSLENLKNLESKHDKIRINIARNFVTQLEQI